MQRVEKGHANKFDDSNIISQRQNGGLQKMPRNLKEVDSNLTLLFPHIPSHATNMKCLQTKYLITDDKSIFDFAEFFFK